jgi:2-iminobutanoate/2-iminopropanoate deaminase
MRIWIAALPLAVAGCVSTDNVVPAGQDAYTISAENDRCSSCTPAQFRATNKASAYCAKKNETMVVKDSEEQTFDISYGKRYKLTFSCVAPERSGDRQVVAGDREVVATEHAPRPVGPYSQAIKAGGLVFVSGQIALDPADGKLIEGDIKAQTERVLRNLAAVLAAAGSNMDRVVRTTVFLKDISEAPAMNEVYGTFFTKAPPARTTVQAAGLPKGALLEIDVVALQ